MQLNNLTTTSHGIGAESGSMIYLENTTSKDMYINRNGMIEGDNLTVSDLTMDTAGVAEFNKLTIGCSSASSACITAYGGTTIKLQNSTITGEVQVSTASVANIEKTIFNKVDSEYSVLSLDRNSHGELEDC